MSKVIVYMHRIGRRLALLACVAGVWQAHAAGPGEGIQLGTATRISPALQLNFLYDSNVARQAEGQRDDTGSFLGSPGLEVKPSLSASYQQELVQLDFSYEHLLRRYLAADAAAFSFADDITARVSADILPKSMVGIVVRDSFVVRNYPSRTSTDVDTADSNLLKRRYNYLWLEGRYSPGSALDLLVATHWLFDLQDYFKSADEAAGFGTDAPFKNEFGLQAKGKWRFFPQTLLLAQADFAQGRWNNIPSCSSADPGADACTERADTVTEWDLQFGIAGMFTTAIQANFFLGYGGLYNSDSAAGSASLDSVTGLNGLLAQAQLVFSPQNGHSLSLGVNRRYSDSVLLDYSLSTLMQAGYNGTFFDRLSANVALSMDLRRQEAVDQSLTRRDIVYAAELSADYRMMSWLWVSGSLSPMRVTTAPVDGSTSSADDLCLLYCSPRFMGSIGVRGVY